MGKRKRGGNTALHDASCKQVLGIRTERVINGKHMSLEDRAAHALADWCGVHEIDASLIEQFYAENPQYKATVKGATADGVTRFTPSAVKRGLHSFVARHPDLLACRRSNSLAGPGAGTLYISKAGYTVALPDLDILLQPIAAAPESSGQSRAAAQAEARAEVEAVAEALTPTLVTLTLTLALALTLTLAQTLTLTLTLTRRPWWRRQRQRHQITLPVSLWRRRRNVARRQRAASSLTLTLTRRPSRGPMRRPWLGLGLRQRAASSRCAP